MDKLKKLLDFLSPLPAWLRVVIAAFVTAIVSVCLLMTACTIASSCGVTQSVVNNIDSDGNTIEMGVTPSTTTSTTVSPDIPINAPLKNSLWIIIATFITSSGSASNLRFCVSAKNKRSARNVFIDYICANRSIYNISSYTLDQVTQMPSPIYPISYSPSVLSDNSPIDSDPF